MEIIERSKCVITGEKDLEYLYTFKDFPVYMGVTENCKDKDLKCDMTFMISKSSGMIQMKSLIALDDLYSENHNNSVGTVWMKHHNEFADFIKKFQPKNVLEIGGATGILAKVYMDKNNIKWSIIEPNPIPVEGCKAEFIKDFFNEKYILLDEYDSIVHSHVLEHMYEPDIFIKNLSDCLGEGKKMFFSIPNMMEMLKRKYTNTLNFEHTFFATEQYIEYLLAKFRFEILNKEYFMDDGSIFYAVEKRGNVDIKELDKNLYSVNKGIFIDYINYHRNMITKFNEKMKESNMKVYLFGAHIFTQYLIEFGLDTSKIISILDNDVHKQGKRLSGTELYVESPKILKDEEAAIVILKVGIYNSEIKKDILENINSNIEFLE